MKHILPIAGWLWMSLLLTRPALAQAPDTLPGHAHFSRLIAASMCTRIQEEARKQDFNKLSAKQADELFMRLTMTSMSEHAGEFASMLSAGQARGLSNTKMGRNVGETAVQLLSKDCPVSMALILRTSSAQKGLGSAGMESMNNIADEEKAVLQPIADSVCTQLAAADARQPLKAMTPARRSETMTRIMQTEIIRSLPTLMTVYSTEQMNNKDSMRAFGIKLASLMMTKCPTYLILLGEDAKRKR
ncbi:hypothetical protein GCM10027594_24900 [Hymenobacter agri]